MVDAATDSPIGAGFWWCMAPSLFSPCTNMLSKKERWLHQLRTKRASARHGSALATVTPWRNPPRQWCIEKW
ncbi:hypothetical protein WI665_02940 [Vibrio cholerae]